MKEVCQNIILYLDGDLEESERSKFESHLPGCMDCRKFLETWKEIYLEEFVSEEPLSETEKQELWERLQIVPQMRRVEVGLIAASVIFILLNFLYFYFIIQTQNSYDIDQYLQQE